MALFIFFFSENKTVQSARRAVSLKSVHSHLPNPLRIGSRWSNINRKRHVKRMQLKEEVFRSQWIGRRLKPSKQFQSACLAASDPTRRRNQVFGDFIIYLFYLFQRRVSTQSRYLAKCFLICFFLFLFLKTYIVL